MTSTWTTRQALWHVRFFIISQRNRWRGKVFSLDRITPKRTHTHLMSCYVYLNIRTNMNPAPIAQTTYKHTIHCTDTYKWNLSLLLCGTNLLLLISLTNETILSVHEELCCASGPMLMITVIVIAFSPLRSWAKWWHSDKPLGPLGKMPKAQGHMMCSVYRSICCVYVIFDIWYLYICKYDNMCKTIYICVYILYIYIYIYLWYIYYICKYM